MSDDVALDNLDTLNARKRVRKQARFLAAFRQSANIKHSCKVAGIGRSTYYDWRANDPDFQALLPDAEQDANDTLEFAAYDRAVQGVSSYVVSNGRMVCEEIPILDDEGNPKLDKHGHSLYRQGKPLVERKYSDALLQTLLKARMPEKYKDRSERTVKVLPKEYVNLPEDGVEE